MEKAYWLGRKKASMLLARNAASSAARSIHYELAARYDTKAANSEAQAIYLAGVLPPAIPRAAVRRMKSPPGD